MSDDLAKAVSDALKSSVREVDGKLYTDSAQIARAVIDRLTQDDMREKLARSLCRSWGYDWDGDPDQDDQVIPAKPDGSERPSKQCFLNAVTAMLAAAKA